jgi:hypothetical protein
MRGEISDVALTVLLSLDQTKADAGFSHAEMIYAVAAGLAQMPEEDRARFRAFDQIEVEMHGPAANRKMYLSRARQGTSLCCDRSIWDRPREPTDIKSQHRIIRGRT